jgi:spermidine synthase
MGTQVLSAHIPMLLHQAPQRVLVIGLGSGVTLGHAGRYPVSTLHCAEIDPAVIEGARYFKAYNYGIHEDPRATIFAADGRNFLLASPEQYDVIISEPSNPWMAGLAYLFTHEFYGLAKRRLAPGGLMCQWLQLYQIFPGDLKLMLNTFHEAFPYVSVWSSIPGDLLLVGSMEPHQLDYGRLAERMASPAIKESLALVQVDRPHLLLQLFRLGTREVEQLTADVTWLHQDDQPSVEFNAPRALYTPRMFSINYAGLEQFTSQPQAIAPAYGSPPEDAEFYKSLARLWESRFEPDKAKDALEKAVTLDPTSSETWGRLGEINLQLRRLLEANEALTKAAQVDPANVKAYHLLARLRWQQGELQEAQRFYEQAASLKAPDGPLAEEIGHCLREVRQFAWAAEYYRSSMSQGGGGRATLVIAYAQALKALQSWEAAEQVLRFGMVTFPGDASFSLLFGETLLDQERWLDAVPLFQRTLTVAPGNAEAYYGLGHIALGLGQTQEAIRYLKRGLQYNPYHREALRLLHRAQHQGTT